MNWIKFIFITSIVLLFTISSSGQRINYKESKDDYFIKNYRNTIVKQKYSPLAAGVCNYVFPAAGYLYVGEPLRAVAVFGGELVTSSVFVYGLIMSMNINYETGLSPKGSRTIMFSGMIATGLIQIWSIFDVVKVAKIKNLAYQDNKLTMRLKPELSFLNQNSNNFAMYGLRLSVDF